jgi:hypothetical protein
VFEPGSLDAVTRLREAVFATFSVPHQVPWAWPEFVGFLGPVAHETGGASVAKEIWIVDGTFNGQERRRRKREVWAVRWNARGHLLQYRSQRGVVQRAAYIIQIGNSAVVEKFKPPSDTMHPCSANAPTPTRVGAPSDCEGEFPSVPRQT